MYNWPGQETPSVSFQEAVAFAGMEDGRLGPTNIDVSRALHAADRILALREL